jgi:tRNA/tmRNA/rRNA uracil-C5-methylase (TrmA/RlmC/RlmD family)
VALAVGERVTLTPTAVAHGGHCVARHEGRVVFVRHALPGEQVEVEVTEVRRAYARADAVRVLATSPDRVEPPCPYARPGACGGCDLQHVAPVAQRRWKATVICEQLRRLGDLSETEVAALQVHVAALPGGVLGWRSRVRYRVDDRGRVGLLAHRSHRVVPVDRCRIAAPAVQRAPVTSRRWSGVDTVTVVAATGGDVSVEAVRERRLVHRSGPELVTERAIGREWTLPAELFWQVHPAAADTLAGAVVDLLQPRDGERSWDLYGGAGLFTAALAERTRAPVWLVESSPAAAAAARDNLSDLPDVVVHRARVASALRKGARSGPEPDLVVLDPPRSGAGAAVVRAVVAAGPRAVAYVACDPAAFARDVATFRGAGWALSAVRAYDCFPMTHHVECVGLLEPAERSNG